MAQGDVKSTVPAVSGGSTATINPASGETWNVTAVIATNGNWPAEGYLRQGGTDFTRYGSIEGVPAVGTIPADNDGQAYSYGTQVIDDTFSIVLDNQDCFAHDYLVSAIQTL